MLYIDFLSSLQITLKNTRGTVEHAFKLVMDSLPEINRVERYATAMVCDKGENIKFRLTFTGAS